MDEIKKLRDEIDVIDDKLMNLLEKRYILTREIGIQKEQSNKEVFDVNRESHILNKISKYSHSPQIRHVYTTIIHESKKEQRK